MRSDRLSRNIWPSVPVHLYVCPRAWNFSDPTERILMKFYTAKVQYNVLTNFNFR